MAKAATIYTRVSTGDQSSEPEQERRARAFAEAKGWTVEDRHVFTDHGISATRGHDRAGWTALTKAVDGRQVDAVVVFQISRSARNTVRLGQFIELCRDRGVIFASVSEGADSSTPMGRLMLQVIGALAELESEIRSARVKERVTTKRSLGEWLGGRRPFGFRQDGTQLVVDPTEKALLQEAAAQVLSGVGLRTIARSWNDRGIQTPQKGKWSGSTVRNVLANERHAGNTLTRRDHRRVLEMLAKNAKDAHYGQRGHSYLLTGLLTCGACGGRMGGRPQKGVRRYICLATGKVHLTIKAEPVENFVISRSEGVTLPEPEGVADPSGPLLAERDRIEGEMEALGESDLPDAVLRGRARKLQKRLEAVDALIEALPAPRTLYKITEHGPPTALEWREYLETIVDRVVIASQIVDGRRSSSTSDRVSIQWRPGVAEVREALGPEPVSFPDSRGPSAPSTLDGCAYYTQRRQ